VASRWLSPRGVALHFGLVAWVLVCGLAAWWQVTRALQGNQYSYLYAIEWPGFAAVGVFIWWRMLHSDAASRGVREVERAHEETRRIETHTARRDRDQEDEQLAAYNDHLARLAASGRPKDWRRQ